MEKRAEQIKETIDEFFIIVNIETLRDDKFVEALKKSKNEIDMIIFDECHKCLDADTIVETENGLVKIEDIVNNKLSIKVLSDDGKFHEITDYYKIPSEGVVIEMAVEDSETGQIKTIRCSEDHLIKTRNRGFIEAKYIDSDDDIELL